jgi:uncharacterized membrane protein YbhN (UPF0104 family)
MMAAARLKAIFWAVLGNASSWAALAAAVAVKLFVILWTRAAYRAGRAVERAKRAEDAAAAVARAQAAARDYDRSDGGVVARLRRGEF